LYATPSLAGPANGITSVLLKPASRHQPKKSAAVKSKASPNSIDIFSDISSPSVFASRIIDQVLDDYERAPRRQGIVSCADKVHFLLQIPIVEDHAHRNHIRFRQRLGEEIKSFGRDSIRKSRCGDFSLRDPGRRRKIGRGASRVRVFLGYQH
jgi:hypothetical protein